jgi:Ser/Thr protein kinase RdoA (MazF antagonist)
MTASTQAHGQVHGMDGSLVATDWPPLTVEELRPILAEFPSVGAPVRILTVSPRPFSAASVVETTQGRVFVKRHSAGLRNAEGLREEHRFLVHLYIRGASVPQVLETATGDTALECAGSTYEVHTIPTGIDLYREALSWTPFFCVAHARSAGETLAHLHHTAIGFNAPARPVRPLISSFTIFAAADPVGELDRYLAARPVLAAHPRVRNCALEALELLAPFHAELQPLLRHLPALWTHNDLHPSNLLWSSSASNARATATLDFGLADRTFAVFDLAQAIERSLVEWLAIVDLRAPLDGAAIYVDQLDALLAGYQQVRALSRAEAAALAPVTALCHYEFALTEADYFLGIVGSDEKAAYAYESYLVGHARWFRSAGTKLLDAIRRRAEKPTEGAR